MSQPVILAWDPVPDVGIQGYKVYIGTQSGEYSVSYFTGPAPLFPVSQLELGRTYYFSVSTINGVGVESALARELAVTVSPPPLPVATSIGTSGSSGLPGAGPSALNWSFPASQLGSSPTFVIQSSPDLKTWTDVDTVAASEVVSNTAGVAKFSWPIQQTGGQRFYRLTARNFVGIATTP